MIGAGVSVAVNVTIQGLLGDGQAAADNKLLDVMRDIAENLRGGTTADAEALRGTDLERLDTNLDELTRVRAVIGATTNRLESAGTRLDELEESSVDLLSNVEDADMAEDADAVLDPAGGLRIGAAGGRQHRPDLAARFSALADR